MAKTISTPDSFRVYHATSSEIGDLIEKGGFRDATGTYLTANEYTGVWISDSPMDDGDGIPGCSMECYFEITILEEVIAEYEWVEEFKSYREWLVPADLLNQYPRKRRQYAEDQ